MAQVHAYARPKTPPSVFRTGSPFMAVVFFGATLLAIAALFIWAGIEYSFKKIVGKK